MRTLFYITARSVLKTVAVREDMKNNLMKLSLACLSFSFCFELLLNSEGIIIFSLSYHTVDHKSYLFSYSFSYKTSPPQSLE